MNRIILILSSIILFTGVVSGATLTNTTVDLGVISSNQTLYANNQTCIIVHDSNATDGLYAQICYDPTNDGVLLNQILVLQNQLTNSISNSSALQNMNQNLTNIILNLTANYSSLNSSIFINGSNQIINLTFNQSYYINSSNTTIIAPIIPLISENTTLIIGQCYNNTLYNLTVCAPPNDLANIDENITCGQTFIDSTHNITINSLPTQIQVISQNVLQSTLANVSQFVTEDGFTCFQDSNKTNCQNRYNIQTSQNSTESICLDNLTTFCTGNEVLDGNIIGCFRRYFDQANATYSSSLQQVALLQSQNIALNANLSVWTSTKPIVDANTANTNQEELIFVIAAILILLAYMIIQHALKGQKTRTQSTSREALNATAAAKQEARNWLEDKFKDTEKK